MVGTGYLFPALDRQACGRVLVEALALGDAELLSFKQRVKSEVEERFSLEQEGLVLEANVIATVKEAYAHRHPDRS